MKIAIYGTVHGSTGYASKSRGVAHYLKTLGEDVDVYPIQAPDQQWYESAPIINSMLKYTQPKTENYDIKLLITNPFYLDNFEDPTEYVIYTTFECSNLPVQWIHRLMATRSVLTTSKFAQEVFEKDGIPSKVSYEGYDEHLYYPDAIAHSRFRFLCVAEWMPRKNIQTLIKVFADTFAGKNDVELFLKTWNSHGLTPGEMQQVIDYFNRGRARIVPIFNSMPDNRMRELYAQCDVSVSATTGEGFGRVQLESEACGLPNIVPNWSAHTEFVNDKNGWLVKGDLVPVLPHFIEYQEGQNWFSVDEDDLAEKMLYAYNHPDEVRQKGVIAAQDAKAFTWPRAAKSMIRNLEEIVDGK